VGSCAWEEPTERAASEFQKTKLFATRWIADRPERLDTPWTPEETAKMLVEKKEDKMLKTFGLWPFGNLGEPIGKVSTDQ
jgi:hypothetical protein